MADPIAATDVFQGGDELAAGSVNIEASEPGSVGLFIENEGETIVAAHLTPTGAARLGERLIRAAEDAEEVNQHG